MDKNKISHHLNCIKMCQSDKAVCKRIEVIFAEGVNVGWQESGQCPNCLKGLKEEHKLCDDCIKKGVKI